MWTWTTSEINDTVGHNSVAAADRGPAPARLHQEGDTVARLGAMSLRSFCGASARPTAPSALRRRSCVAQEAVNIVGRDHFVRASIGITLFPDDAWRSMN